MECVNISSNDILQLGVLLLSYKEVLHDSRNKITKSKTNSPHIYQKINPDYNNAGVLPSEEKLLSSWKDVSVFDNDLPTKCNPDKKGKKRKKITHSLFNTGHLEVKFN